MLCLNNPIHTSIQQHTTQPVHITESDNRIMAATELRQSRFGASVSGGQPGMEPSLADTLPTVDFNFNDLRERMAQFTVRFDDFIERGRKRVLEERNAFRMSLADVEGKERTVSCMRSCHDHR
jgi:hypothetical protein